MNTVMLYAAVLWLAVRQRWYESKLNPWGMGSPSAKHRVAQHYVQWWDENGDALMRVVKGRDEPPRRP